jgi:hypothetical protein
MGGVGAPWEAAMGSSPERGKRGKEKRRQGAAWGATRGGEGRHGGYGLLVRALLCCSWSLLFVRRRRGGRRKERKKKRKEKKKKIWNFFEK